MADGEGREGGDMDGEGMWKCQGVAVAGMWKREEVAGKGGEGM